MEILAGTISHIPEPFQHMLVQSAGNLYAMIYKQQVISLKKNLQMLLNMDEPDLSQSAGEVFRNFASVLYDFFHPESLTVDVPDREKLEAIRHRHGGIMLLTFHMGNWELGARTMKKWGWPVTAVYQPYQNKKFKRMIEKRRAAGVNFIPVGKKAAFGVRQALQRGDIVAMLGDHTFGEEGTPVNLLGHKVIWPKGPVVLAIREKAPIVVAVVLRTGPRRYVALIEDPIYPEETNRSSVEGLVQEVANKFGKLLQQYPTQWYRFKPLQSAK